MNDLFASSYDQNIIMQSANPLKMSHGDIAFYFSGTLNSITGRNCRSRALKTVSLNLASNKRY